MICAIPDASNAVPVSSQNLPPHFGYRGPQNGKVPELPFVYLPRGLDNSSGGQAYVGRADWGPLQNQLLHFSFGTGSWFVVLRDEVAGQQQGAIVTMAGDFLSGAHRGRFNPHDHQLYVVGMNGWTSYTPDDGCLQRIRFTGDRVQVPTAFHVHENGIRITFSDLLDASVAATPSNHFAQCWNYRYSAGYGSQEFSTTHPGVPGHDPLTIQSATVLADGKSLFLEMPDLQPCNQLHLRMHVNDNDSLTCNPTGSGQEMIVTVHQLDEPFTDFKGYLASQKTIAAHPMLSDLALQTKRVVNPWRAKVDDSRPIVLETGKNLTFATNELTAKVNERIGFTLSNPDVVPHNWVLVQPNSLQVVGELANRMIANPDAVARQYIPESDAVLVYTDIVSPGENQIIYFQAPAQPGRYPFLCTFPGHWMVMNGILEVEQANFRPR